MTTIPLLILSAAIQAAPDTAAAVASETKPAAQSQAVQQRAEAAATRQPLAGFEDEIGKLTQLQDEIRAILEAGLPPAPAPASTAAVLAPPAGAAAPNALAAADTLYCMGRYSEALSLYESAKPTGKDDTCWVLFQKANSLRWMGKGDDAIARYQQLITEHPDSFLSAEAEWWLDTTQWKKTYDENKPAMP